MRQGTLNSIFKLPLGIRGKEAKLKKKSVWHKQTDASLSRLDSKKRLEIHVFLKVNNLFIVYVIGKAVTKNLKSFAK